MRFRGWLVAVDLVDGGGVGSLPGGDGAGDALFEFVDGVHVLDGSLRKTLVEGVLAGCEEVDCERRCGAMS